MKCKFLENIKLSETLFILFLDEINGKIMWCQAGCFTAQHKLWHHAVSFTAQHKQTLANITDVKFEVFIALWSRTQVLVMWRCYWVIHSWCSEWTHHLHLQRMKGQRRIPHIMYSSLHDIPMQEKRRGKGMAPTHSQPWWVSSTMLLPLYLWQETQYYYQTYKTGANI